MILLHPTILFRSGLALLGVLVLWGCNGNPDPPAWDLVPKIDVEAPRTKQPYRNDIIVYLDTSASMAGYLTVAPDKKSENGSQVAQKTIFGLALQELRTVAGSVAPSTRLSVRYVTSSVGDLLPDIELARAANNPTLFRGGDTNLAGAIGTFAENGQPSPSAANNGPGSDEATGPVRFHILITDGVQSTRKTDVKDNCAAGSDQICVNEQIRKLLEKGWAGCIVGIRSDFSGTIYAQASVKKDLSVPYTARKEETEKLRPFYLYIFSPDRDGLDKLVRELVDRLRPLIENELKQAKATIEGTSSDKITIDNSDDLIRELNLSFPFTASDDAKGRLELDEAMGMVEEKKELIPVPPRYFTLKVNLDTDRSPAAKFSLLVESLPWAYHALLGSSKDELSSMVQWKLVPVFHSGGSAPNPTADVRYPELALLLNQDGLEPKGEDLKDNKGQFRVRLSARWPPGTGSLEWRVYRLEGRLDHNQQTPLWIRQWSTPDDTNTSVGNRTFDFERSVINLWRSELFTQKPELLAQFYFRVGPK